MLCVIEVSYRNDAELNGLIFLPVDVSLVRNNLFNFNFASEASKATNLCYVR